MDIELLQALQYFFRSFMMVLPVIVTVIGIVIFLMLILAIKGRQVRNGITEGMIDAEAKERISVLEAHITFLETEKERLIVENQLYKSAKVRTMKIWGDM